ncbi:MAG: hypothetical protein IKH10_03055, partial [Bacteroidetes bacterium]|nr:hypothetical protein [Bacteroidota bacterium]
MIKYVKLLFLLVPFMLITNVYAGNSKFENDIITPELKSKLESKLLNAQLGSEYFIIIPPNDPTMDNYMCDIYIGACEECTVYIEQPQGVGLINALAIAKPYSFTKVSIPKAWVIHGKDEKPENLALKIWSLNTPIVVYVCSHAGSSAEGYTALPINALGTQYVHCSWSSNQENQSEDNFHTGFLVGAIQNDTRVEVKLRGKNLNTSSSCITDGSAHKIGSKFMLPIMKQWQVINIQDELIDVQNARGKCDFTGSTITSNKPIAMFSFHEGADIPLGAGNRSNLVEQLLPVNMWGKQHISLQLRCAGAVPKPIGNEVLDPDLKVGDYFRVVAAEEATLLNVKWWNTKTGEAIKELKNQRLDTEGSFWEWNENMSYPRQAGILSIQGVALFESNKPVQVMQYSFSSGYATNDSSGVTYSPLMIVVPPIEQYVYETVIYTVPYNEFGENYINIIAEGDASDSIKNEEMLGKILIGVNKDEDGFTTVKLIEEDKTIIRNSVPGTNYYFSTLPVAGETSYVIKSKTKFGAIGYGFVDNTSYGWLASMALIETFKKDTLPPQIYQVSGCVPNIDGVSLGGLQDREKQKGKYNFLTYFADTINYQSPDDQISASQSDLGISYAPRLIIPDNATEEEKDLLYNLSISNYHYFIPAKESSTKWDSSEPVKYGAVEFSIEDIYRDALGFVEYRDRAGNVTVDTIIYIADKLEFYVDSLKLGNWLEFGSCWILDSTYTAVLKIRNVSKKEIHIQDLFLSGNEPMYSITKGIDDLPLTLGPDEEQEIEITYNPTISSITLDQITLYTDCLQFNLRISGSCGLPKIKVSDIDFGDILVGTKTRYNQKGSAVTLTITNNGASDLIITGFHFDPPQDSINGPFFYEAEDFGPEPPSIEKPWIIARNGGIKSGIRYFYFMPSEIGEYKALLYFENNIMDLDSNSNRKDYAIIKGNGIQDNTHIESGVDENNYSLLPVVP